MAFPTGCAEAGVVRRDIEPAVAAHLIFGMLQSIPRWYQPGGRLGKDEIARRAFAILEGYVTG